MFWLQSRLRNDCFDVMSNDNQNQNLALLANTSDNSHPIQKLAYLVSVLLLESPLFLVISFMMRPLVIRRPKPSEWANA
jgi:hypothetical protein